LVSLPWQFRWSSCRAYTLGEANGLVAANTWYEGLAPTAATGQQRWRQFLLGEDTKEEAMRGQDWVLGGEEFPGGMQQQAGRPAPRGRGRAVGAASTRRGGTNQRTK
jgi:hypothetical protein